MSEQLIQTPCAFGENGNYLLERELGSGGMGGVYMGRDKMLDRPIAVKVMLKELGADAEFVEKFKKEAQAAARLIHPNIVQVYSYGITDGLPYIVMELASGGSLDAMMNANSGHADVTRVLKVCQQTAQALQCASDQGFVHGDIKPENILLDANGNAKLVDFGLASMQKETDEIWGTPYYIAPEKVRKEIVDFRADMYSLGATLYHALTGVAPFEGDDSIAVVKKRFEGAPRKPSEIRPEITPAVDALVMKMLSLNKEDRYPSFEALLEAFKDVLSKGLTSEIPAAAAAGSAKPAAAKPGARRMVVRGRRTMTAVKRPSTTVNDLPEGEKGNEGAVGDDAKPTSAEDDDEEEGGNLGLKVVLFILGGLLLVGGVIGGLVWFKVSSAAAEKAAVEAQILEGCQKAGGAIADTVNKAKAFADEFDTFAHRAIEECQKPTDELTKALAPEIAALLKPEQKKPEPPAPPVATNAPAPKADAKPAPKADAKPAQKADAKPAQKAAATNAPAAKAGAKAAAKPAPKVEKPAEPPKEEKPAVPPPQVVLNMNDLWQRAYECQACAVRIRQQTDDLVKKAVLADQYKTVSRENMEKLAELSRQLVEAFDQIKGSKDVETVRKGITYIKSKGESVVKVELNRLRIEKIEADRKAKAAAAAEAEKARLKKIEDEKKALVDEEREAATSKFAAIVAQGSLRQLDWKGAIRQIDSLKADFKTAEGQLQAETEIRKINAMKKMQDVFVKNAKGHKFRGKLKGCTVAEANERDMTLLKADGKTKTKMSWQKFYKDYPGNVNELINLFVVQGRKNAKPALNLRDWAEAMTGAALTMQLVYSEVNGAVAKAESLAKETVKQFPDYAKIAQGIFPDMKFEVEEE